MDFRQRQRRVVLPQNAASSPTVAARSGARTGPANLRRPRSAAILQWVPQLDSDLDPSARADIARWIADEYRTEIGDLPIGFFAQCHLGPPYVDHRLDLLQSIVDHFTPVDVVPEPFAAARMLVRTGGYAFIEVYLSGALVPVRADGTPVT